MISKLITKLRLIALTEQGLNNCEHAKILNAAANTIEELSAKLASANMERSTAYYNDGWIPVSERLPDSGRKVLLQTEGNQMTVAFLDKKLKWYADSGDHFCTDLCAKPIAWQPLPDPYEPKGENHGESNI